LLNSNRYTTEKQDQAIATRKDTVSIVSLQKLLIDYSLAPLEDGDGAGVAD